MPETVIAQVFISYSWDSESHRDWVRELANKLEENGISTFLDQWDVLGGMDVVRYMETQIRESEFVLLVCTPKFAKKADASEGGVGYEKTIITGEIFNGISGDKKFVPILRGGDSRKSLPSYLKTKAYIDFRPSRDFAQSFDQLLRTIISAPKYVRPKRGNLSLLSSTVKNTSNRRKQINEPSRKYSKHRIKPQYDENVFLNCPTEENYTPLLIAIIFTVFSCGFRARSARELAGSGTSRLQKILTLISTCRYGIHDISGSQRLTKTRPELNASFELGVFIGAQRFDRRISRQRNCLVLDSRPYHYHQTLSDIAGYDVAGHNNNVKDVIEITRNWLQLVSRKPLPSGNRIHSNYRLFRRSLPTISKEAHLQVSRLHFNDICYLVALYLDKLERE